ncbi:hypothetical protein BH11MYX3_BH11MYX3_20080 [soil metagenome]
MWRSPFLSSTSLVLALAAIGASGCSDDSCGPGDAPLTGIVAGDAAVTLTFGNMTSRAGNDCPDNAAPQGVIALTIEGMQTDGTGFFTLCIPRPDLLAKGGTLGLTVSTADIRIIDLRGTSGACTYSLDSTRPPTGTGIGTGVCGNGTDKAGFAIELDGAVSLRRTCGATIDSVPVQLTGRVAVPAE